MSRLGSRDRPAVVRVRSEEIGRKILAACKERGWEVIVGIEPDKPEDISDFQRLLNPIEPVRALPTPGRNDPCHCGSGKKFKKCHGA
ncbi:MAG: SEC-C metal-binding domain-containing protein [Deltaproteobacteria bacterium]|nr:SEC-C metal-binding domain-containing protein [Deltaproteobacteria bacterium]